MIYFWFVVDRIVSGWLIYYAFAHLGNNDYLLPAVIVFFLGSLVGIMRGSQRHIAVKITVALAYLLVGLLFFWAIFSGVFNLDKDFRTPLIYLLISLKIIQAFDPAESRELIYSLVLTLFLALVLFCWPF